MKNSRREAVLSAVLLAAGLLPMSTKAYVFFPQKEEALLKTLNSQLYFPSSFQTAETKAVKVATVCFVTDTRECAGDEFANSDDMENNGSPDGGGNPDYDLNDAERCRNEGYTISGCSDGFEPSGKCPYGDYYAKCVETCPSSYKTCEPPYYGVGEMCGGKYASCEEDTERACQELNPDYTNTCESGWQINPNDKCKYDETFGTCCNQCIGYDYTTIPEGYVQDGEACTDCNDQTKYKVKPNPCDGFLDCGSMGPAVGASSCLSGTVTKYDNCKSCPNLGTLTSCPSPYICEYEECSNRYYKTGCQSGYDWNASTQTCTAQCDSSYQYTCTGANESPSGTACGGKYQSCTCADGYVWENGKCVEEPKAVWGKCTGYAGLYCKLGDIVYSDGTCSTDLALNKTPIAIVVYISSSGCGQALAIGEVFPGTYWGTKYIDVPTLTNYATLEQASTDTDSCENTKKLLAGGDEVDAHASWFVYGYTTEGTKQGDWCLPAAGILLSYHQNRDIIVAGFAKAGIVMKYDVQWWSSTEQDANKAWALDRANDSGMNETSSLNRKEANNIAWPVIEF